MNVQDYDYDAFGNERGAKIDDVNNPNPPVYGDVDGDGVIDSADVTLLRRYISAENKTQFELQNPLFELDNARVTGHSGNPNANDVAHLRQYVAGFISVLGPVVDTNPFRYCAEYWDVETGNYYLRFRYYNPRTGAFSQEDPARDGLNWYTYCGGNPVRYVDPWGLWKQVNGGWQAEAGDTLWGLAAMLYGDGSRWTEFGFVRDPGTLRVGEIISIAGSTPSTTTPAPSTPALPQVMFRDVTSEINRALNPYVIVASEARKAVNFLPANMRYGGEFALMAQFAMFVRKEADWDLKVPDSWERTIRTQFPGAGVLVNYRGLTMTPEQLGNYTYGLLGAAFGFSYDTLIAGSYLAARLPTGGERFLDEVNKDWNDIWRGYFGYSFW